MSWSFLKNKEEIKSQNKEVLVVSKSDEAIEKISEILILKGYDNLIKLKTSILELSPEKLLGHDISAVITYADEIVSELDYSEAINRIFTKDVVKIILSNNDSIKINHNFDKEGIIYLNWQYQFNDLISKISQNADVSKHRSIRIGILGCKGGVGNSFIAYQIAKNIRNRYLSPTLLVQGVHSSFTIDYYAGKNFEKECINKGEISFYKESSEDSYEFLNEKFNNFNFIIFDHSVQSLSREEIENILNNVDLAVLVFECTPAALRKAKEIYRVNEFLLTVSQGVKRLFLCMNNHRKNRMLVNDSNLKEIIGADVDTVIGYKDFDLLDIKNSTPSQIAKKIDELTDKLVGARNSSASIFTKIFGKA